MVVFVMNNFDEHIDRKNTGAFKWDHMKDLYGRDDLLPMWVADMDFPSPIGVQKALLDRVMHPVYGYTAPMPTLCLSYKRGLRIAIPGKLIKNIFPSAQA